MILSELLYLAAFVYNELEKNEECKKYLMACLRMEPDNLLKEKISALKLTMKNRRVSKLQNLDNSVLMSPLKKSDVKNKQLDLFNDSYGVMRMEDDQENFPQQETKRRRDMTS